MSGGSPPSTLEHIDAVDVFSRTLFLRAKQAGEPFADVAQAVRQLHLALRHLRVEAADSDSLLNRADASVYVRQLQPIVEDCDFTMRQLETVLDKYADARGGDDRDERDERDERIANIRSKLANERTNVGMFLDTVQLRNPANRPGAMVTHGAPGLETIKDKVDVIANRLFSRRDYTSFCEDEDGLWLEFKAELEKEGFSPDVLRKHKDILRAYIRELESMLSTNGAPPTVRGLLEQEAMSAAPQAPKEMYYPGIDNEKCFPSMKAERRMPDHAPVRSAPAHNRHQNSYLPAYERRSSSSDDATSDLGDSMALISTRDLIAMDGLAVGMAGMHLQPPVGQNYSMSPNQRYLPPPPSDAELSGSPNSQLMAASPRFVPPMPAYNSSMTAPAYGTSPRAFSRLAPDRYGQEIPLDAQWTKIKRSLISSEVLSRAGVRFEARPDYVAILGHLSREQIADYARQSADLRAARAGRYMNVRRNEKYMRERADSKSSRDDEDNDSVLWDESDTTDVDDDKTSDKGTKSYYIVNPPDKDKTSPSSTVQPKPILKNKNENKVRFDPEPHEVEGKSPRPVKDIDRDRERRRGDRRRHHDYREHRDDGVRHSGERDRHRGHDGGDYPRRHHRDRRSDARDRSGDQRREDRAMKKKTWGETLGAVGIGGAAVSLLSVLAEAASGM